MIVPEWFAWVSILIGFCGAFMLGLTVGRVPDGTDGRRGGVYRPKSDRTTPPPPPPRKG